MNLNVILVAFSCQCLELTINFNTVNDNLCVLRVFARVLSRRCLLRDMFLAKAPRWLMIIDDWLLIADVIYPRMTRMPAGGWGLLLMTDCWLLFIHGWHGYHGCPQADGGLGIGMCRTGVVLGEWICEECVFLRLWCGAWLGTRLFLPSSLWVAVGWGVRITNLILQL